MYKLQATTVFKKQRKLFQKRGYDLSLLNDVIIKLVNGETLAPKYRDHALSGSRLGQRDCHIALDWILIYRISKDKLILELLETGTHSDLSI